MVDPPYQLFATGSPAADATRCRFRFLGVCLDYALYGRLSGRLGDRESVV